MDWNPRARLVRAAAEVAYRTGALGLWRETASRLDPLTRRVKGAGPLERGAIILMFHRVTDGFDPFRPGIPVDTFVWLCQHLAEHYEVLPLEAIVDRCRTGRSLSRVVALTFDDGYACNYRLALPELRRYSLPATVFVTTGAVTGKVPLWFSRLATMLERSTVSLDPFTVEGIVVRLDSVADRVCTVERLIERLVRVDPVRREVALDRLSERLQVDDFSDLRDEMATWSQLREMDAAGFTVAAHTVTHPILSRVDPQQLKRELCGAREELAAHLHRDVSLFAYPRGGQEDFNAQVMGAVRAAGYRLACSCVFGANTPRTDPFALRRVSVYADTRAGIALQIERFFHMARD